jgi:hypothetical protein
MVYIHDRYQDDFRELIDKFNFHYELVSDERRGAYYRISTDDESALIELSKLEELSEKLLEEERIGEE